MSRTLAALALVIAASSCARERGEQARQPPRRVGVRPTPTQTYAPPPTATAPVQPTAPPSATASPPPSATAPAPSASAISPTDLIKFQDACWKNCDQFACMKIAEAYRTGAGLPADVLAGRRYAVHACQECGTPSVAIDQSCKTWGLDKK